MKDELAQIYAHLHQIKLPNMCEDEEELNKQVKTSDLWMIVF